MFSLVSLSKSQFFTRVVDVTLLSHSFRSCFARAVHVAIVSLVSGTRIVK